VKAAVSPARRRSASNQKRAREKAVGEWR
jgi:hypothetical protein